MKEQAEEDLIFYKPFSPASASYADRRDTRGFRGEL